MKKKRKTITGRILARPLSHVCKYGLLVLLLISLDYVPAYSLDFMTEDDFVAEKSIYKDYPLKILFRKLNEGDAGQKREIRNMIILKQVFDRRVKEKAGTEVLKFEASFGVIKNINEENLRVWIPETGRHRDFYVGIDRIPLENVGNYKIMGSNIGKYALILYTLDDRIYKIQVEFPVTTPTGLSLKREHNQNIVSWAETPTAQKPSGYRIFLNDKPFKTVEGTAVSVPRTKGKADRYYVKAIYRHGGSVVESDASDVLYDEITAKEMQQELLAGATYGRIMASLNSSEWEKARKLLYDNRELMAEYLDQDRKRNAKGLIEFFEDIDEGDRLRGEGPETVQNLERALGFYEQAEQKAKALPASIGVLTIARQKIDESRDRRAMIEARERKLLTAKQEKAAAKKPDLTDAPVKKFDRNTEINLALKEFNAKKYRLSLDHFMRVLSGPINDIKRGGKRRIHGTLKIPVRCRAEIFFLIALDQLLKENNGEDKERILEGLEEINENIENRTGLWVITRNASKRAKIKQHIATFDLDSY